MRRSMKPSTLCGTSVHEDRARHQYPDSSEREGQRTSEGTSPAHRQFSGACSAPIAISPQELERIFEYDRVRTATKLTHEEVAEYLSYLTAREVSEMVFPGPAPRIVPSDPDDDPVVHTAVVGQAEILCTLNRDFYHASVLEYCKERGVLVGSDVAIVDLPRRRK
jgi:hypothetical protein